MKNVEAALKVTDKLKSVFKKKIRNSENPSNKVDPYIPQFLLCMKRVFMFCKVPDDGMKCSCICFSVACKIHSIQILCVI